MNKQGEYYGNSPVAETLFNTPIMCSADETPDPNWRLTDHTLKCLLGPNSSTAPLKFNPVTRGFDPLDWFSLHTLTLVQDGAFVLHDIEDEERPGIQIAVEFDQLSIDHRLTLFHSALTLTFFTQVGLFTRRGTLSRSGATLLDVMKAYPAISSTAVIDLLMLVIAMRKGIIHGKRLHLRSNTLASQLPQLQENVVPPAFREAEEYILLITRVACFKSIRALRQSDDLMDFDLAAYGEIVGQERVNMRQLVDSCVTHLLIKEPAFLQYLCPTHIYNGPFRRLNCLNNSVAGLYTKAWLTDHPLMTSNGYGTDRDRDLFKANVYNQVIQFWSAFVTLLRSTCADDPASELLSVTMRADMWLKERLTVMRRNGEAS